MNALPSHRRPRLLTKSRFRLALECPTKLFYTDKLDYANARQEDNFLQHLAEGGYQVGALARFMYPGGLMVKSKHHAEAVEQTRELLRQDTVTIYEGALSFEKLFIRADVLRKRGNEIELIEVKAKSYHPGKDSDLRGSKGALMPAFVPYLWDVAFQRFVAGNAFPHLRFSSFLMLVDKSRNASTDGLNQMFPVRRVEGRAEVTAVEGADPGSPILFALGVEAQVQELLARPFIVEGEALSFSAAMARLADGYSEDRRLAIRLGAVCGRCEFRVSSGAANPSLKSGFHECWSSELGWGPEDFAAGAVTDLFRFAKKDDLIARGAYKLSQVTSDDLGFDDSLPGADGLSTKHRQSFQCTKQWPEGGGFYFDEAGMAASMREWRYPLNFIDFETCATALPFKAGRRPYEQTAFQLSHHVMDAEGNVVHRTQFLHAVPGECPNAAFVDALRTALAQNEGTVFRWAAHENTILVDLRDQLLRREAPSAHLDDLIAFIDEVTVRKA